MTIWPTLSLTLTTKNRTAVGRGRKFTVGIGSSGSYGHIPPVCSYDLEDLLKYAEEVFFKHIISMTGFIEYHHYLVDVLILLANVPLDAVTLRVSF